MGIAESVGIDFRFEIGKINQDEGIGIGTARWNPVATIRTQGAGVRMEVEIGNDAQNFSLKRIQALRNGVG